MKFLFIFFILVSAQAWAQNTAITIEDVLTDLEKETFAYEGKILLYSSISIESCVFLSKNIIVIQNFCFPQKKYPAKGYLIISEKFGVISLYEESLGKEEKRDIVIEQFPEFSKSYFSGDLRNFSLEEIDASLEKLYYAWNPGCWVTNYSYDTNTPTSGCAGDDIAQYRVWEQSSQDIVTYKSNWNNLLERIKNQID